MKTPFRIVILLGIALTFIAAKKPEVKDWQTWAKTPPMGWTSYGAYGASVHEDEVKANADFMAKELKALGWKYIIIDNSWSYPHPPNNGQDLPPQFSLPNGGLVPWLNMDGFGRLLPDVRKFPSCNAEVGFKPLADYIHLKGLLFGVHVMRGVPKQAVLEKCPVKGAPGIDCSMIVDTTSECSWLNHMYGLDMSKDGAQQYLNSVLELYASWAVDYIKLDDMSNAEDSTYHAAEVLGYRKAIDNCKRRVVLSLASKTPLDKGAGHVDMNANMWQVSADVWDNWDDVVKVFPLMAEWNEYRSEGCYPNANLIPLGRLNVRGPEAKERNSNLNNTEKYSLLTLWGITKSPLIFGGDLMRTDDFTLSLISNKRILEMNQFGTDPELLSDEDGLIIWKSKAQKQGAYIAVFNTTNQEKLHHMAFKDIDVRGTRKVYNLWTNRDLGAYAKGVNMSIKAHGVNLYLIK